MLDLAGTVMQDDGAVLNAYRAAFAAHGVAVDEVALARRRGASKPAVFRELAGAKADAALATFEAALRQEYETGDVREIAGTSEALETLRRAKVKLALTSGFPRELMDLLIRRLGLSFDYTVASDEVPLGRPAPFMVYRAMMALGVIDVASVAVVGDTVLDLEAANHAHAGWVVGVTSGAHTFEQLGIVHHTHLIGSVASLPAVFGLAA